MNSIVLSFFPLVALIASGYLFKKYRFFSEEFWAGAGELMMSGLLENLQNL